MNNVKYQEKEIGKSAQGCWGKGIFLVIYEQFHYNECIMRPLVGRAEKDEGFFI